MLIEITSKTAGDFQGDIDAALKHINQEMERRSYLVANELRNAALLVLRGQRHGRRYKVPGTYRRQRDKATGQMRNGRYYTASAPGEPPAVRTGAFRMSWQPTTRVAFGSYFSRIESDLTTDNGRYNLGELLEGGTERMKPRPYQERILKQVEPAAKRIYSQPYF